MTALFYLLVLVSFIEAGLQIGWVEYYYRYGIVVSSEVVNLKDPAAVTRYALRSGKKGIMIRQQNFSIARYVFHHAFAKKNEDGTVRLIFFADLKFVLFVIFLVSVPVGLDALSIASGIAISLVLERIVTRFEKANISVSAT